MSFVRRGTRTVVTQITDIPYTDAKTLTTSSKDESGETPITADPISLESSSSSGETPITSGEIVLTYEVV